ncbi:MAG: ABC transporter permease [Lachnospiraceae bacterium]|nr:ABC transporter permease [Lachnospiraceae bacterium]
MLNSILYDCIYHSAPIILCVLGGCFAYKANVLNIALEGMMLNGAFVSVLTYFLTGNMLITVVLTLLSALIYGFVFSYFGITLKGNVIVIGLALNMVALAIAGFVLVLMDSANIIIQNFDLNALKIHIPLIENIPVIGHMISGHPIITYLSFVMIFLMYILMYKTKFGVYVRVVGENEEAAKSIGIKTSFYKYAAVLIGAIGCALAGMNLSLERLGLFTNNMTASRGFIAIAAIYCGQGKPVQSAIYAILFGLARSLSVNLSIFAGNAAGLFDCIPYLVMMVVLSMASYIKHKPIKERGYKVNE